MHLLNRAMFSLEAKLMVGNYDVSIHNGISSNIVSSILPNILESIDSTFIERYRSTCVKSLPGLDIITKLDNFQNEEKLPIN